MLFEPKNVTSFLEDKREILLAYFRKLNVVQFEGHKLYKQIHYTRKENRTQIQTTTPKNI